MRKISALNFICLVFFMSMHAFAKGADYSEVRAIVRPKVILVFPTDFSESFRLLADDRLDYKITPDKLKERKEGLTYSFEYPENAFLDGEEQKWISIRLHFNKGSQYQPFRGFVIISRSGETLHTLNLRKAEALSFSVEPQNFPNTSNLYAGDKIRLRVGENLEKKFQKFYWYAVQYPSEIKPEGIINPVEKSAVNYTHEESQLRLRQIFQDQLGSITHSYNGPLSVGLQQKLDLSLLIGEKSDLFWRPEKEGMVDILLLTQSKKGVWSSFSRKFQVLDLRAALWLQPQGISGSLKTHKSNAIRYHSSQHSSSFDRNSIYEIFDAFLYVVRVGDPIRFLLHKSSTSDAGYPVEKIGINFGDNTHKTLSVKEKLPEHAYQSPGDKTITVYFVDTHKLRRKQYIHIKVLPEKEDARIEKNQVDTSTEDSFGLFRIALANFSEKVAQLLPPEAKNISLAPVYDEEHDRTIQHGDTYDLFDSYLVTEMLSRNIGVVENDQGFSSIFPTKMENDFNYLISYKLKRASVEHSILPAIIQRTAKILALVRIYNASNNMIVRNEIIELNRSDLIKNNRDDNLPTRDAKSRDAYPPLYLNLPIEIKVNQDIKSASKGENEIKPNVIKKVKKGFFSSFKEQGRP